MKSIFSLDNPLVQFLTRVCDLIIVNILFIICCIPIFTIGAAICGLTKVSQAIVMGDEQGIWDLFTTGFKSNFKQATIVWLCTLLIIVSIVCYWMLINAVFSGVLAAIMLILMIVLAVSSLAILSYLFPLITRYDNTLREHLRNAGVLAITRLILTVLLIVFAAVPFILPLISLQAFLQTFIFWVVFGFSFLNYMANLCLRPIYKLLEQDKD